MPNDHLLRLGFNLLFSINKLRAICLQNIVTHIYVVQIQFLISAEQ